MLPSLFNQLRKNLRAWISLSLSLSFFQFRNILKTENRDLFPAHSLPSLYHFLPPSLFWKGAWGRIQIRSLKRCRLKIGCAGSELHCKAVNRKLTGFASRGNVLSAHCFRRQSFCTLYERLTCLCVSEGNGAQFKYSLAFSLLSSWPFISPLVTTLRNVHGSDRCQLTCVRGWCELLNILTRCQASDHLCSSQHRGLWLMSKHARQWQLDVQSLLEFWVLQMQTFRN